MKRGRPKHDDILTPREWQVLELIQEGLTNAQIAAGLGISESGAKYHVAEILSKLAVESREGAAAWAAQARRKRRLLGIAAALVPRKLALTKIALASAGGAAIAGITLLFLFALGSVGQAEVAAGTLGKIAYIQDGAVWVKAMPDGKPQRLTGESSDSHPSWSPSGRWLTYVESGPAPDFGAPKYTTWVLRSDGTGRHRLDSATPGAGWSPVADRLTYFSSTGSVVVEDADGGNRREVVKPYLSATENGGLSAGPVWSPDGKWLAYAFERWPAPGDMANQTQVPTSSTPVPYPTSAGTERTYAGLWRVEADGTNAKEIFNLGQNPRDRIWPNGWSPDGAYVLFLILPRSYESATSSPPTALSGLAFRAVAVSGAPVRDLGVTSIFSGPPSLSPSGAVLAVSVGEKMESWTSQSIAVVDAARGTITRLTGPDTAALSPAWSPDGTSIAYVGSIDAGEGSQAASFASRRIWVMAPDGSDKRKQTGDDGYREEAPQWSTDGAQILFARMRPDACGPSAYSLWLLNPRNGSLDEVLSELPLFGANDEILQVGQVPSCHTGSSGLITDFLGHFAFSDVFDWWQAPPATSR